MGFSVTATGDALFTASFPPAYADRRAALDRFLAASDLRLTNLETNLADYGHFANQYSGGTWVNTRPELFPDLASFGFDFYGTANNHCMDYSYGAMLSTLDFLDRHGLAHAGTGKSLAEASAPALLSRQGKRIAVFALDTSGKEPSMAGRGTAVFRPRPGVNFVRHTTCYHVSEEDLETLRRIAKTSLINFENDFQTKTGFRPADPAGVFSFGEHRFTTNPAIPQTYCNKTDLARITDGIRQAKRQNDYVFLLTHCHSNDGISHAHPPAYLRELCHAAIDAGADAVFGGGCHELRGLELYAGRPIFYSLGDFIFQSARVEHLPPDFMEKYGLPDTATAQEALDARSQGGKYGLYCFEENFLSVLPRVTFENGHVSAVTMAPLALGYGGGKDLIGLPYVATGAEGEKIFRIFSELSAPYGTKLEWRNGAIHVKIEE